MEILNETRDKNPGEKTIVFSQFTSMLDLIEAPLKRNGFRVCRCKYLNGFFVNTYTDLYGPHQMTVPCRVNYEKRVCRC